MRQVDLPEQCSQGGDFGLWHSRGGSVVNMVVGPSLYFTWSHGERCPVLGGGPLLVQTCTCR